jgi:hypothetical protein
MAKVPARDDLLWFGEGYEIRAMQRANGRRPALEWVNNLDEKGFARFKAAATNVANSFRSGRRGPRAEKIKTSRQGLWELRVTPRGGRAPFLRLLFRRDRNVLWATHGFSKQSNDIKPADIERGDRIAAEWLDARSRTRRGRK